MKRKRAARTDWSEAQRRLRLARDAMEALDDPGPDRRERVLRERAVSLAQAAPRAEPGAAPGPSIEVVEFASAGERYAFETAYVAHVCPVGPITSIPGAPNFVVGIMALQGDVLSVIDLRSFLQLPLSNLAEPSSIIVLRNESMELGVVAEDILGIERYPADCVERGLATLGSAASACLKGVTPGRTAILDAGRLLCDPRLAVEIGWPETNN